MGRVPLTRTALERVHHEDHPLVTDSPGSQLIPASLDLLDRVLENPALC